MALVLDSANNPIGYFTIDLVQGEILNFILKVVAADGRTFKSGSPSGLTLTARETGSGDPFTSLVAGFDLSGFTPDDVISYDVRATGIQASGRAREAVFVGVINTPAPAGWLD